MARAGLRHPGTQGDDDPVGLAEVLFERIADRFRLASRGTSKPPPVR
jgi:hypothetical protein